MRAAVIVNPRAGGRRLGAFDPQAAAALVGPVAAGAGVSVDLFVTTGPGDGRERARKALERGVELVVAWGGDGTVNEVAAVLAGGDVPLGIVPVGSGNGLARELALPRDPTRALRVALQRATRSIDVGTVDDRVFVNVAGFGFDAHVAEAFNTMGKPRGLARYVRLAVAEMFRYTPQRYVIEWDGGTFEGTALLVAFANSRQYGNGASVAPRAELDDGALDLVAVRPTGALGDLWRARRLFTGTILHDSHVRYARAREAVIASGELLHGHVDGELIGGRARVEVRVRPRVLRVCCRPESQHRTAATSRP